MEQKCLDCLEFGVVFLRAIDAGAAVLHNIQFLTPDISFNIDLYLMNSRTKNL